jgi:sec-independent protein translocase protein TatB
MFDSLGWGEMSVLLVLALFVFGPDRLPALAADLGRAIRRARRGLHTMTSELKDELGPELGELSSLRTDLGRLQPAPVRQITPTPLDPGSPRS